MGKAGWWRVVGALAVVVALGLTFATAASASKHVKRRHVLITFSGSGSGNYSTSTPEQDISAGVCEEPASSAKVVDHFTFGERFRLSFPDGGGNPEGTHVTAGGHDVSSGMQRACTNQFGNKLGGASYDCTTPFIKAYRSQGEAPFPMVSFFASHTRFTARVTGGVEYGPQPTGTNCVGAPIGGAIYGFTSRLNGRLSASVAKLNKHGSVSIKVRGSKIASCNAKTCDRNTCKNDSSPGPVPLTCHTSQSYTGELKVQLVR